MKKIVFVSMFLMLFNYMQAEIISYPLNDEREKIEIVSENDESNEHERSIVTI